MESKEKVKMFSLKKLLLTILCTVMISIFIGSTILFIYAIPSWMQLEVIVSLDKDSEVLIEIGKSYQENIKQLEENFNEEKEQYGDNYPAEGIYLFQLINLFSANRIVLIYAMSLLIGIVLGTIIYIVAVQNIKGKQIVFELIVAFIILFMFVMLLNAIYGAIINKAINEINPTEVKYHAYIYDLESNKAVIPYIIVAAIIYIVNMVRQKILTNKLNKELNNK